MVDSGRTLIAGQRQDTSQSLLAPHAYALLRRSPPKFDAARCVHTIIEKAGCRACIDACPRSALAVTEESLTVDAGACDGCELCAAACPTGVIAPANNTQSAFVFDRRAFIACDGAQTDGLSTIPCLNALSHESLFRLHTRGVRELVSCDADCANCRRQSNRSFDVIVEQVNRVLESRALTTITVSILPAQQWAAAYSERDGSRRHSRSRRAFLSAACGLRNTNLTATPNPTDGGLIPTPVLASMPHHANAIAPNVPIIDARACDGCDACAKLCPTGAIRLQSVDQVMWYQVQAERCNGCRICQDVCARDAITLRSFASAQTQSLALVTARCRRCGVDFHVPSSNTSNLCPTCSKSNHPRLFSVLGTQ